MKSKAQSAPRLKRSPPVSDGTAFRFLHTEVNTGKTLAKIALRAKSEDKIARNRSQARLAHDTALRFFKRLPLTRSESQDIYDQLQDLKADLHRLGEAV